MKSIDANQSASKTKHLTLIQVFRGIASLLVVGVHGELIFEQNLDQQFLFNIFHFGGSGVDFFFVLSGFIIYYVHKKDLGKEHKLKQFVLKRLVRIYPIYWVILAAKLIASLSLGYSNTHERSWWEIFQAFSLFPLDRGILSESFLGVSWTLTYEIFFYCIFGLLIYFGLKKCLPLIGIWLGAVLINSIGLLPLPENYVVLNFLFSILHLEFALGILAAYLISRDRVKHGEKIMYVGMFLFTLAAINFNYKLFPVPDILAFAIPSTLLVIGAAAWETKTYVQIPSFLILLGNASFSLYLIHGFVMNNVTKITIALGWEGLIFQSNVLMTIFALINMVLATIVGCLLYLYIEKPLVTVLRNNVVKKFS